MIIMVTKKELLNRMSLNNRLKDMKINASNVNFWTVELKTIGYVSESERTDEIREQYKKFGEVLVGIKPDAVRFGSNAIYFDYYNDTIN